MATKKKEKTVQELLREKQLEQIENFSIDDGEEDHSLDQILEAASQQGILDLYNPFEERAKKIAEEEAQVPKRPSEAQTARQTFDQLGDLGNMVKKTETETLPKITNEAIKNYNLSKTGRDYLSKYDDSTSYSDVKNDIEELKYRKGGAARRDNDTAVYDRAIAMLEEYAANNYSLNDSKTSYADKEAIYENNKQLEEGLGDKSNSATDSMYRDYALMSWLGAYDHKGIKDSATNQAAINSFNEATKGKGYDLSGEVGGLKDDEIASKADEIRTYFQNKYGYKYDTDYLDAAQNFYSNLQDRYNKAKTENKTYERTGQVAAYTADIAKKDDYADKSSVGDYGTPTTQEDIDEYLKNNQAIDYNKIQGFDSKNVDSLPDKLGSFLSAEGIENQNTSSEFPPERKIAINLQKTDNAWTHPADTPQSGYDDLMTEGYNNGWDVISDVEKGAYYYIYNTEGKEAAYEYLNSLKNTLQKRKNYDNVKEATKNSADSGTIDNLDFILRSAASVPDNAFGGATGTLDNVAHYISGEDVEPYSPAHAAALSAEATREASGEALDEQLWHTDSPFGINPSDIYGGVMSSADMLTSYFTGEAPYGALMGLSAAESTARDLYEQGEDNATIAAVSTASGIAEALFEKLSIEQIWNIANLDGAKTAKEIIKKYAYNMARAAGVEASEEVATEAANMVVDNVIRGSRSDTANASIEEIGSRLYKAGVGGAIGGLLGGGGATTLSAVAKGTEIAQDKSERNKYIASVGADVTNAGNTQALLDTADQMKDNAEVQAQAEKVRQAQTNNAEKGTESSAKALSRETGKLYAAIQDSNAQGIQNAEADEIKAAIKQAYAAETGEDANSDTVTQAAEAIYKSEYTGEKLTRAERNLASTSQAQSAVESVRNNPDLIEQSTQKAQERAFNKYISTAQLTAKQETKADEDVDIAEFNVHKDDGKVYTADGRKQVDIASVASIGENDITFALKDGQTETAKSLDMPTKQAVLAQSVLDVQKDIGVELTPEIADTLYKGYEQSGVKSVSAYMQDAKKVLFNGYTSNTKIDNTINLPQGLRNRLYSMGRQLAASHTQAQQKAVNNRVKGNKSRKGSVTFVDGIRRGQLDARRRAGVDTVENLAKSLGFDVVFYRSTKNGKGRYSSEYVRKNKFTAEGQQAPSGFWRGGKMYLDINAGMNGEGLILFTASHELVHMIREGSPEAFQELADFLVKNYAEQGVNINDLVLKEMSKSTNLTRDEAFEEVIAESCETFLRDIHLNDKAQELYKQNPSLWSRIREALKRIINSIKEAYAVARPQSEEARITNRADIKTLEKAYDLWTKGIIKSAENLRNMERAENGKARYSFAGRNAETADIGTLSDAILAEEEGATSEEIRKQTGWFRGLDGKWRFEIDDSDMKIKIADKDSYFISELVDHPQLFKAYPALEDNVLVSFFDLPKGERGYYDSFFNRIVIDKRFKSDPEEVADILAHEIQHVIQGYEDTALGASPKYWQQVLDSGEEHKTVEEKREEKKLTEQYEREREKSSDFVDLSGELFSLTRKYFFEDENPDYKDYEKIYSIQNKLYKEYGKEKTEKFQNLLSKLNRLSGGGAINDAFALYHRTAGEIEARDNTARRKLSTEQRKNARPDIDRKDVVFAKYQSRVDSNYLSAVERGDMETAQRMVDEAAKAAGYNIKAYHGTARADRVGNVFRPERATSGPMAFFTDSKEIAGNYARDKADTSIAYDSDYDSYYTQFRVQRGNKTISISELWNTLPYPEKQKIKERAKHIKFDDDAENIIYDEKAQYGNGNVDDYTFNMHRGNALDVLVDSWLESGDLWGEEEKFLDVLKLSGVDGVEYFDPDFRDEKVYETYLNISNPYDTSTVDNDFIDRIEDWWSEQDEDEYYKESSGADMWDKNSMTVEDFVGRLREDLESKTSHAWTSIPDAITAFLKYEGYDGIKDTGGKSGGESHTVWIPFSSEQIKSADPVTYDDNGDVIPLSQRFDSTKTDIRYQSRDDDLFSIELSDDDTITNVAAREFVTHHEDMGEVLKNIADIDIEPKRVDSIINRVAREYLGSLDAEAKHTLSIEIQLALERVNNTDAQTVSDTIIDAVRRAIEKGTVSDERAEANYKDLLDAFKGKKFYLTDEQINQLKEHDMTLDSFRKAMFGKMTIVKRENAKRSINGGYADAQQLSLEGLHDVLADADAVLGLRSWQWDQENYDAPYIIKEAFDGLNRLRNQPVSQVYSDQAIDDMAVAMSAKITGGIVEAKYNSRKNPYITKLVNNLKAKQSEAVKKQKEKNRQKLSELKQKERERAEKRETELKKKYQEQRDKSREGRKRTELRHKIRNLTDSLQKRLTKPKGSQYVPRQLIAQTVDVLNAVNLDTGRSVRLSEKLALLRNEYDKLKDREESYAMYDGVISNMLLGLNDTVGNTSIMDMTLSQLKQVYDTIRSMDHVIRESVKMTDTNFKHDAHQVGRDWIAEIRAVPKSHVGALSGYVQTMLSAERFFNRIAGFKKNSTSLKLFDMLNKGQLATTQYEMEFTQIFADLIQDDKIKSLYDTKKMVDIGLVDDDGNKVPITRGMMLSLYMHLQNEDNIRHVMGGGLTVPDMKDYYKGDVKKAFGKGMKSVRVGQLDYSRYAEGIKSVIEKQLTEYERGWIEAAHEFFDEASRKALNETTMKLYGFRRANVDNYFPIHTDSNYRAASFENIVRDMSLENSGFMKERVKASNPILLEDIVDVVNDQISKTAKYCGMTLPIKNFEKVYGTTTVGFDTSVQKELNKKFSASSSNTGATKYIDNLLTDLTSGRSSDDGPFAKRLGRARGFLAQSTLTLNPRVAIAQTASVVTAAPVVGYKNITKALTSQYFKVSDEEIAEITPLFWLRRQGYATIEIGDIATLRKQKHKIQSKAAKALNWINAMDSWAVRRLFVASKYYMQENYSNLDPQSDEYKQKLSEVYNKVIEKTQPNYTVLQRPDILRNPNALLKSLTMFMTQRLQNFNIIYDSVGTFNKYNADYKAGINNVTADDVKEARSTLIRSITSQVASAATIVGMKLFADFLLHSMNGYRDDDDEITAESLSLTLLDNFADTVFGNILFASELYSAVKSLVFKKRYYGISLSGISSIVDAITDIINLNNGVTVESVNKVAMSVCQVLGIPLRNAEKIGKAIYYWISDISSGEFMESGIERNTKQNIHRYETKLLSGDNDGAKKIVDEMLEKKKAKGKNDKDAKSDVRSNFTTEYKKRYLEALKSNNAEEIKNIRQTLYSSGLYGTLSDLDKVMQKWVAADKKEQSE